MKHFKRLNQFKASNVIYDIGTGRAYSYGWWRFVDVVELQGTKQVVFNNHSYSNSTIKHQCKVRSLLHRLGISIDLVVDSRSGLQSSNWKEEALDSVKYDISTVEEQLNNKRRHKRLDGERMQRLGQLKQELCKLSELLG
jgi:hypothetical protein